jgi:hypothetical protein
MSRGDHVYVRRRRRYSRYSHHGIDCGDGTVIHYAGEPRTVRRVERSSLAHFAGGAEVLVRAHRRGLPPAEVVAKAESRLGSVGYHLVWNNCEHFATWCSTGSRGSKQVRGWAMAAPSAVASLGAAQAVGIHLLLLGSLCMGGLVAWVRPTRRSRRGVSEPRPSGRSGRTARRRRAG